MASSAELIRRAKTWWALYLTATYLTAPGSQRLRYTLKAGNLRVTVVGAGCLAKLFSQFADYGVPTVPAHGVGGLRAGAYDFALSIQE